MASLFLFHKKLIYLKPLPSGGYIELYVHQNITQNIPIYFFYD